MEKKYLFIIFLLVFCFLFCGCNFKQRNNSAIKYQRKLEKYLTSETKSVTNTIDLSEGPKTRYDFSLGPRDLDFDVKLNTRY